MADNAIIGDITGVELPQMPADDTMLLEEKKMAKYSKSKEFQKIKTHFEERIEFYQKYLPDGRPVASDATAEDWKVANLVIAELKAILDAYELAAEEVKKANA